MPAPVVSVDVLLTALVVDYLSTTASVQAGLPAVQDAPRVPNFTHEKTALPCLVVSAETEPQGGCRRRVTVTVAIHYQMPAEGETEKRTQVAAWADAVSHRLAQHDALYAAIAALPVERRTGWQLRRVWAPSPPGQERQIKGVMVGYVPVSVAFDIRS